MLSLSLFITNRYLKIANLPFNIAVTMYIITAILFIFDILNDLNIVSTNLETMNYLNELDFTVELPEIELNTPITDDNKTIDKNYNVWLKFLDLFSNNNTYCCSIDTRLKNLYYINKDEFINYNKTEEIKIYEKYLEICTHNKEVSLFIDSFMDILKDLESIQNDLKVKV